MRIRNFLFPVWSSRILFHWRFFITFQCLLCLSRLKRKRIKIWQTDEIWIRNQPMGKPWNLNLKRFTAKRWYATVHLLNNNAQLSLFKPYYVWYFISFVWKMIFNATFCITGFCPRIQREFTASLLLFNSDCEAHRTSFSSIRHGIRTTVYFLVWAFSI